MTFNDLHKDIEQGCNCINQVGVSENTEDSFARSIKEAVLSIDDFKSYHEIGMVIRRKNCKDECKYRGVSVSKLNDNTAAIKAKWQAVKLIAPQGTKRFVCTFRLKVGAGKVWDTSNNKADAHHTLLKADGFNLASVEVKEIVPVAEF